MSNTVPKSVFLAGSSVELISAMACLSEIETSDAAVFVERNISVMGDAIDPLLALARGQFPNVKFIEMAVERANTIPSKWPLGSFLNRWRTCRSIEKQLDSVCRTNFQMGLKGLGTRIDEVFFTALHDYVLTFLTACKGKTRVFYPHGFDHPRKQQVKDQPYLLRSRSAKTALQTLGQQEKHFGPGGLLLGIIGHLLPGINTISLPFTGVDRVITFRSGIDFVPNEVKKVNCLEEIFRWLLESEPWRSLISGRQLNDRAGSLLLLLPECDRHPIWEKNRNYGLAHLRLLKTLSLVTHLKRFVIKAHVRSDGSAATWLANFLVESQPEWSVEVLPISLAGLPIEALALTGEFSAVCSLASCSLPPGLGFGIPHYVSFDACDLFDSGWQEGFWVKYSDAAQMLVQEGICREIDANAHERERDKRHATSEPDFSD